MDIKIHIFGDIDSDNISSWENISLLHDENDSTCGRIEMKSDKNAYVKVKMEKDESGKWIVSEMSSTKTRLRKILSNMFSVKPFRFMTQDAFDEWLISYNQDDNNSDENMKLVKVLTEDSMKELKLNFGNDVKEAENDV